MEQEPQAETVERARVDRMIDVLSYASVGSFDEALERAAVTAQDGFGVLEEALRLVISELRDARDRSDASMRELARSKSELEEKLNTIEVQKAEIQELSASVLDIWSGVIVLPVVGAIDTGRAVRMTERLLQRIVDRSAQCAIIDLTGVGVVDSATADHLIGMIRAARMLGCFCVITGIGPEVARTLVDLGLGMSDVLTLRTLESGLRACLAHLERARDVSSGRAGVRSRGTDPERAAPAGRPMSGEFGREAEKGGGRTGGSR